MTNLIPRRLRDGKGRHTKPWYELRSHRPMTAEQVTRIAQQFRRARAMRTPFVTDGITVVEHRP